ncbi:hypothetical protein D3C87_2138100 [compost metagenome]
MLGPRNELLEIDLVVAEGGPGFAPRRSNGVRQVGLLVDGAHATAAAAPARLQHQWIADLRCQLAGLL